MKPSIEVRRASHVNTGTSVPRDELAWPEIGGRVSRLPHMHVEVDERSEVTPYGGLAIATAFLRRFKVAERSDRHVKVFLLHMPYHESDHVLAQALNLYVGGTCIEDVADLQHSEAVLRIIGACRIPDPTTAGRGCGPRDFLRRFHEKEHQLPGLRNAVDEVQSEVWRRLRRGRGQRDGAWSIVDVDGHVKPLYGVQKEGADFYKSTWCYQPLIVSLAGAEECLAIRNRPGSVRSSDGTAGVLDQVLPRVRERGGRMLVRGDSDFDRSDVRRRAIASVLTSRLSAESSQIGPGSSRRSPNRSGSRSGHERIASLPSGTSGRRMFHAARSATVSSSSTRISSCRSDPDHAPRSCSGPPAWDRCAVIAGRVMSGTHVIDVGPEICAGTGFSQPSRSLVRSPDRDFARLPPGERLFQG